MDAVFSLWHDFRLRRDRPDSQSDLPMDFFLSSASRNSPLIAPWFGWNFLRGRQCTLLQWAGRLKKKRKRNGREKKERKKERKKAGGVCVRFEDFFIFVSAIFARRKRVRPLGTRTVARVEVWSQCLWILSVHTPTPTRTYYWLHCWSVWMGSSGKFPARNFMHSAPAPTAVVRGLLSVLVVVLYVLLSFDH